MTDLMILAALSDNIAGILTAATAFLVALLALVKAAGAAVDKLTPLIQALMAALHKTGQDAAEAKAIATDAKAGVAQNTDRIVAVAQSQTPPTVAPTPEAVAQAMAESRRDNS